MLVEQVDRLSRLSDADWKRLRSELDARQVRVVGLDLPTSWMMATQSDEFTCRMFAAVNAIMLDVLAAVARKDYEPGRMFVPCNTQTKPRSNRKAPKAFKASLANLIASSSWLPADRHS